MADLGDRPGRSCTPASCPLTVWFWAAVPDGDFGQLQAAWDVSCPAAPDGSSVSSSYRSAWLRPQAARQHGRPRGNRCRAWWKSTRPISIPDRKTSPAHRRASLWTQPSAAVRADTERFWSSQGRDAACGWEISSGTAAEPTSDTCCRNRRRSPTSAAKTDGWSGYAAVPADRHNVHVVGTDRRSPRPAVDPAHLRSNLKGWARGVYRHGNMCLEGEEAYRGPEFVWWLRRQERIRNILPVPPP